MKLTVREALAISPLKKATVLAGERGLDREILNVNIVEVPDTVRWMRGGEIMFSSGFAFGGDGDKGCALISSLWDHKMTALVLKPGIYMARVPEAMIEYAEYLGFPLMELPKDMPFNTCIEAIYALLLDKKVYLFNDGTAAGHFGDTASPVSGEIGNICKILADRIRRPILYLNHSGTVEALIGEQYLPAGSDRSDLPQELPPDREDGAYELMQISVELEPKAYLAVRREPGFPAEMDTAMIEYAATMIASELQKEQAFIEQKKQYRANLLQDLVSSSFGDPAMLKRRSEILQYDLEAPFVAFAVRAVSDGTAEGDRENLDTTRNFICSILEHGAQQRACSLLLAEDCGLIIGMLSAADQGVPQLARGLLSDLLGTLKLACKSVFAHCAVSSLKSGAESAAAAMFEAREALHLSLRVPGGKPIACLGEMGIYRMLCEMKKSHIMDDFCRDTLRPILSCETGEELLKTLECYYDSACNLRRTADALFLHKNSVKYRLSRIEALLGGSIAEPDRELSLKLCLKYRKII